MTQDDIDNIRAQITLDNMRYYLQRTWYFLDTFVLKNRPEIAESPCPFSGHEKRGRKRAACNTCEKHFSPSFKAVSV